MNGQKTEILNRWSLFVVVRELGSALDTGQTIIWIRGEYFMTINLTEGMEKGVCHPLNTPDC
jgi:hypothetical protein